MAADRAWGWNLDEMRTVGTMMMDQSKGVDLPSALPVVSGFTPINQPQLSPNDDGDTGHNEDLDLNIFEIEASQKSSKKDRRLAKAPKRRNTQESPTASGRKMGKVVGPRNAKGSPREHLSGTQYVSKGLRRTKPTNVHQTSASTESKASSTYTMSEYTFGLLQTDQPPESKLSSTCKYREKGSSPGLVDTYIAAFPPRIGKDAKLGTISPIATFDHLETFKTTEPPRCPGFSDLNSTAGHSEPYHGDVGQFDECDDEFPIDDQDFDEAIKALVSLTKEPDDGSQPQDLSDNFLIMNNQSNGDIAQCLKIPSRQTALTGQHEDPELLTDLFSAVAASSSPQQSRVLDYISGNVDDPDAYRADTSRASVNYSADSDLDRELVDLNACGSNNIPPKTPTTSPEKPSSPKLQWMPPKTYSPDKSPPSLVPASPEVIHKVSFNKKGQALPFLRPPFPTLVRERSPILGLTNHTALRTCFRIGEALNAASAASRSNTDAIIELYARIILSERETADSFKQFFQFGDLFTDKPPYLSGIYSLWKGVGLWDQDSKVFVGKEGRGKMCRVMGRIKRREEGGGCEVVILSVWEVDWEDVGIAKGIACS